MSPHNLISSTLTKKSWKIHLVRTASYFWCSHFLSVDWILEDYTIDQERHWAVQFSQCKVYVSFYVYSVLSNFVLFHFDLQGVSKSSMTYSWHQNCSVFEMYFLIHCTHDDLTKLKVFSNKHLVLYQNQKM